MTRPVKEWIGKTDDQKPPPRVLLRVFTRQKGVCPLCDSKLWPTDTTEIDHDKALINGGENRESNIQIVHLNCHNIKTKKDVAEKAKVARIAKKHHGFHKPKSRPIAGSKRSGWRKPMNGPAERRT